MKSTRPFLLVGAALTAACHHASADWAHAPLAPAIRFAEVTPPRSVTVLVLDAHSGDPLPEAVALVPAERLRAQADTLGIIRLRAAGPGSVEIRVLRIGYEAWRSRVTVSDSGGVAVVAQLRRSTLQLESTVVRDPHP